MLGMRRFQQLHGNGRLEAVQDLCLVRQVLKSLTIIFVASLGRVLTFDVIDAIAAHLLPLMIFLVIAEGVSNFKSRDIA